MESQVPGEGSPLGVGAEARGSGVSAQDRFCPSASPASSPGPLSTILASRTPEGSAHRWQPIPLAWSHLCSSGRPVGNPIRASSDPKGPKVSGCFLWKPRNSTSVWPQSLGPRRWKVWAAVCEASPVLPGGGVSRSLGCEEQPPLLCLSLGLELQGQPGAAATGRPANLPHSHPRSPVGAVTAQPDAGWASTRVPGPDLGHFPEPGHPPDYRMWPLLFSGKLLPPPRPLHCGR